MLMCRKYLLGASALVEAVTLAGFYAPGQLDVVRQVVQYDLNGNATRIVRSACATSINPGVVASMDDVSMSYCGNRLVKAVDQGEEMLFESVMDFPGGSSEYGYDSDGRMISDTGRDIEQIAYSPDGTLISTSTGQQLNRRKFGGKELETRSALNTYDQQARQYFAPSLRFDNPDPLAGNRPSESPYLFCGNNPVNYVDTDGKDWYRLFDTEINAYTYHYTTATNQNELSKQGILGEYMGTIVVVIDGARDEKLGAGDNLYGEGAKLASVTIYGRDGKDDIISCKGFTMTSNYTKFGAIAEGEYNVEYVSPGKRGALSSNYAINGGNAVDCIDGINPSPSQYHPYSKTQKNGVYIHRSNLNGYAGDNVVKSIAISSGCILIAPKDWGKFCTSIGKNGFRLILNRTL